MDGTEIVTIPEVKQVDAAEIKEAEFKQNAASSESEKSSSPTSTEVKVEAKKDGNNEEVKSEEQSCSEQCSDPILQQEAESETKEADIKLHNTTDIESESSSLIAKESDQSSSKTIDEQKADPMIQVDAKTDSENSSSLILSPSDHSGSEPPSQQVTDGDSSTGRSSVDSGMSQGMNAEVIEDENMLHPDTVQEDSINNDIYIIDKEYVIQDVILTSKGFEPAPPQPIEIAAAITDKTKGN